MVPLIITRFSMKVCSHYHSFFFQCLFVTILMKILADLRLDSRFNYIINIYSNDKT